MIKLCFTRAKWIFLTLGLPLMAFSNNAPATVEHDSLATGDLGHLVCTIHQIEDCVSKTITLEAWLQYPFTGIEVPATAPWSTGQNAHKIVVTPPGAWSWDVTGLGCDHYQNAVNITESFFSGPIEINGPNVICIPEEVDLVVNTQGYNAFSSFTWSPAYDDLSPYPISSPGIYALTVTDAFGCPFSDQVLVQQSQTTTAAFTYNANGQTVSFTNSSTNATNFSWNFDNGLNSNQPNPTITYTNPGIYNVCLTASGACNSTTCQIIDLSPTVPWTVSPTGVNHTIILPANLMSDIQGFSLATGDYIGFFYDGSAGLQCGGLGQWTGGNTSLAVYGNDATPPVKNGFSTGEQFKVKVWRASTNQVFDVTAFYAPVGTGGLVTHTSAFAGDGISLLTSITTAVTQTCILESGWNIISSYITPLNANVLDLFAPLSSNVVIVKNGAGNSAIPAISVNGIGNWNTIEGYQVKVNQKDTLVFIGQKVLPQNTPIPLQPGWQTIAYLRENPQSVVSAFSGIQGQISLVKDNAGGSYSPQFGFNTIGNMKPGQGYKVKALANTTLLYQMNLSAPDFGPVEPQYQLQTNHFVLDSNLNTGNNAILVLTASVGNLALDALDEVGVFTTSGVLCGAGVFMGENMALTVWGDDPSTTGIIEGLQVGEAYHFRVWDQSVPYECGGSVTFLSGAITYEPDAFEVIQNLNFGAPSYQDLTVSACTSYELNNETYTASGTYTQIIPNASGCDSIITLHLTIENVPVISVNNVTICAGNTATLTATGADSYSWSNGETSSQISVAPGSSSSYTVVGISNGCISQPVSAEVVVIPLPNLELGPDTLITLGTQITLSAPEGPAFTYLWSTGATTSSIVVGTMGTYTVTVFVASVCAVSDQITVLTTSGTEEADLYRIAVAPNPTRDRLALTVFGAATESVQLLDQQGKVVFEDQTWVADGQTRLLNLHQLPSGIYLARISGTGFFRTISVLKQ